MRRENALWDLPLNLTEELHGFWKAKGQNLHTWFRAILTRVLPHGIFLFPLFSPVQPELLRLILCFDTKRNRLKQ
ncbi:hypothetical protein E2320_005762 [Naja naja]|nr:hypothetical protein E2320_005762 [Naja naja]